MLKDLILLPSSELVERQNSTILSVRISHFAILRLQDLMWLAKISSKKKKTLTARVRPIAFYLCASEVATGQITSM